ncbi:MAG: hypothetical protein KY439_06335 [Actinobacteria bacterium]|nr:hypothetical protein [Actinomycetota bacterium]
MRRHPLLLAVLEKRAGIAFGQLDVFLNVVGGLLWAVGVTLLGYILGETIPDIDKYLLPAIAVIVVASAVPVAVELLRARRRSALRSGGSVDR